MIGDLRAVREYSNYLARSNVGTYKAGQQNRRTLSKNNTGTYTLSVPIEVVRQLKWQDGQKLVLEKRGKTVVITDAK